MAEDPTAAWTGGVPETAVAIVKLFEGFRSEPYDDNPGNPNNTVTIGYGSIRDQNNQPVTKSTPPVTEAEAEALLIRDMTGAAASVKKLVTEPLLVREAAALISWTYNLGEGSLASSTLLRNLNQQHDKAGVPAQMRRWTKQGNEVLLGLLRRRWAESAVFVGVDPAKAHARGWSEVNTTDDWPAFA
jgi:lysozyme